MQAEFGVVFCGGGPAALGPFVRAAGNGRLDELLARRVLIVEQSHHIGGGSLRHYGISSNSLDGYSFDPVADVCPVSGRVNRVGGLKGDARDLARRIIRSTNDVSAIHLVRLDQTTNPRAIRALLDEVDLVIVATGYRVRLPELIDESGDRIEVQLTPAGFAVAHGLEIIAKDGRVLQ